MAVDNSSGLYMNNTSLLAESRLGKPLLLAHRGLAQTFSMEGITNETNTARRIYPPEHSYLENTLPSMEAAFEAGVDIVELDIQSTRHGQLCFLPVGMAGSISKSNG